MLNRWLIFVAALIAASAAAQAPASLKDAYKNDFLVGAAINTGQITGQDSRGDAIVAEQFSSITPENVLKWELVHPKPGVYDFSLPDQYVAFGERHHLFIVGHCLVWHYQVPDWVFRDDQGKLLGRDALLKRMHEHIQTVVGRYKGRINSWDVVNEALEEDGSLRQSLWLKIIGPDYIEKAFQYAHEADPQAQLTYNDYSLENEPKRTAALALISRLKSEGIPITSVGLQNHDSLDLPTLENEDSIIAALKKLGVKVAITELDIDVLPHAPNMYSYNADVSLKLQQDPKMDPYVKGLPPAAQQQLAERYAALFAFYRKHRDVVNRVTFWGVMDGDSWLNDWPIKGRTSYPLLFDRGGQPKPAFQAVIQAAQGK